MGLLARLFGPGRAPRDLLHDLSDDYRAEVEQGARLRRLAERAPYPQAAATLRRLAEAEDRHATLLAERVRALGGPLPSIEPASVSGRNHWERVVAVLDEARRKRLRLVEQIGHWDPDEPEVVSLLEGIEREDQRQIAVYDDLVMRSDPQSID
jgi:hypothetical protein